ncbi:MAG: hypothetical protein QXU18_16290 [Thermoplasmatales archaeon]
MNFLSKPGGNGEFRPNDLRPYPSMRLNIDFSSELDRLDASNVREKNYNSIFSLVRKAVKSVLGKERVGLGLALADLPSQLGAFWEVGGNYIVMNRNLLDALRLAERPNKEINSFVFVILMHEYLHSLGILDEYKARVLTARICASIFEQGHPAYEIGTKDPWQVYPFLARIPNGNGRNLVIVNNFDSDNVPYIM